MRPLVLLVGAVLALAACGGGGAGSPEPVSGSTPAKGPAVGRVDGAVADRAGRAVQGALVVPRPADAQTPGVPEIAVQTDARGRFTWTLQPGSYELVAQLGDRRTAPVAVTVKAGSSPPRVELILPD